MCLGLGEEAPAWAAPLFALPQLIEQSSTRCYNATAQHGTHVLHPLPNAANVLPAAAVPTVWFPKTRNNLVMDGGANFTHARANALIAFYGLAAKTGGGVAALQQKCDAIAAHIGVRL